MRDLTQKQRRAMTVAEAARTAGWTLSAYCTEQGLNMREVYDAIAALRRSGVLPRAQRSRRRKSEFVAVRVTKATQPPVGMMPPRQWHGVSISSLSVHNLSHLSTATALTFHNRNVALI
jgi:hypothetical protein